MAPEGGEMAGERGGSQWNVQTFYSQFEHAKYSAFQGSGNVAGDLRNGGSRKGYFRGVAPRGEGVFTGFCNINFRVRGRDAPAVAVYVYILGGDITLGQ